MRLCNCPQCEQPALWRERADADVLVTCPHCGRASQSTQLEGQEVASWIEPPDESDQPINVVPAGSDGTDASRARAVGGDVSIVPRHARHVAPVDSTEALQGELRHTAQHAKPSERRAKSGSVVSEILKVVLGAVLGLAIGYGLLLLMRSPNDDSRSVGRWLVDSVFSGESAEE